MNHYICTQSFDAQIHIEGQELPWLRRYEAGKIYAFDGANMPISNFRPASAQELQQHTMEVFNGLRSSGLLKLEMRLNANDREILERVRGEQTTNVKPVGDPADCRYEFVSLWDIYLFGVGVGMAKWTEFAARINQ